MDERVFLSREQLKSRDVRFIACFDSTLVIFIKNKFEMSGREKGTSGIGRDDNKFNQKLLAYH